MHREEQRALAARVNMPPGGSVTGSPFKSQIPNGIRDTQKKVGSFRDLNETFCLLFTKVHIVVGFIYMSIYNPIDKITGQ